MTRPDDQLAALFAQDAPPARDPAFSAAVLETLARRRFQRELAFVAAVSLAAAAGLAVLWPVIQPTLRLLAQGLGPTAVSLAVALAIVAVATGRVGADLRLR